MRRFLIVTPVLNGARYIRQTLASIDNQTHGEWRHVVVDAGSTDGTLDIVRDFVANEPRRSLLTGPDRGLYDGIFKGFEAFDGAPDDICFWINADDMLAPWAFATVAQAFDEMNVDWITALPAEWDGEGRLKATFPLGWHPRALIKAGLFHPHALGAIQQESTFFTWRLLLRLPTDARAAIRGARLAGDFLLWRSFSRLVPLATIPTMVSGFRRHGANASLLGPDRYAAEIKAAGGPIPPRWLRQILRAAYLFAAPLMIMAKARRRLR